MNLSPTQNREEPKKGGLRRKQERREKRERREIREAA
jgi:hypothetical protein